MFVTGKNVIKFVQNVNENKIVTTNSHPLISFIHRTQTFLMHIFKGLTCFNEKIKVNC
jgi:hypothetical protein